MKRRTTNKAMATNSSEKPTNSGSETQSTDYRESLQPHTLSQRLTDEEKGKFIDALIQLAKPKK